LCNIASKTQQHCKLSQEKIKNEQKDIHHTTVIEGWNLNIFDASKHEIIQLLFDDTYLRLHTRKEYTIFLEQQFRMQTVELEIL
jgi:hypothetical protein